MSGKASKNNPDARGKVTALRKFNGKTVKPVLFIKSGVGRYMAACFEDGNFAINPATGLPIAYKNI